MFKAVSLKNGIKALFIGLAVTQIIAMAHVFQSNQLLFQKTKALNEAGFVTVPNALVQPMLSSLQAAFLGGLFFTVTLGILLIVLTFLLVVFVLNLGKGKAAWLLLPLIGLMVLVNQHGFNLFATVYVAVVPLAVGFFLWHKVTSIPKTICIKIMLWGSAGVILLALLFATAIPKNGFIRFRDRLLLNHQAGQAVNDFYYRYTLFAAEAIKTNNQKQLVSYRVEKRSGPDFDYRDLERRLNRYDYLLLDEQVDGDSADLTLKVLPDQGVRIENRHGTTFQTTLTEILSTPKTVLAQFSESSDRNQGLRQLTLIGLLYGLPLFVYGALFYVGFGILRWWLHPSFAAAGSTVLCLIAGVSLWWSLWMPGSMSKQGDELIDVLQNGHRIEKLAALEMLSSQHINITKIPFYQDLLNSSDIAIRYKVAQSLKYHYSGLSREGAGQLLKDSNPNVRCMALQSLGRMGHPDDIPLILKTIRESDHWYVQYYAYKALRRLGWLQPFGAAAVRLN